MKKKKQQHLRITPMPKKQHRRTYGGQLSPHPIRRNPSFRQFDKQIIKTISDYLCKHPLRYRNSTPEELERKLSEKLDIDTLETIKTVSTLMAADCFETKQHTNLLAQKINFYTNKHRSNLCDTQKSNGKQNQNTTENRRFQYHGWYIQIKPIHRNCEIVGVYIYSPRSTVSDVGLLNR